MILYLDTSTATTRIWLNDQSTEVETGRDLAANLLYILEETLEGAQISWQDLTGLVVFRGPGSFTGLRIGITVINTIASTLQIPAVGEISNDWRAAGKARFSNNENDQIVLPFYDRPANISIQKH